MSSIRAQQAHGTHNTWTLVNASLYEAVTDYETYETVTDCSLGNGPQVSGEGRLFMTGTTSTRDL